MYLQFQGAARTVTGSIHVLTADGRTVLPDYGIYHGRWDGSRKRNSVFSIDRSSVSAVVLSQAYMTTVEI
jgi:metallo-beta-lactamase family protein